jgi:cytoskeletal protein CcmA (bactofilin family)
MTLERERKALWWWLLLTLSVAWLATPSTASAGVRFEGTWNDGDRAVSLRADQVTRQQALQLLADATGWSIVSHDVDNDTVDLSVRDQPAARVLDMILSDRGYVAEREGDRVTIGLSQPSAVPAVAPPLAAAAPEVPAALEVPAVPDVPAPPAAANVNDSDDRDRVVLGGNLRIEKGERVEDVEVLGGHVDVWGVVEGDLEVMGGEARLHDGAVVMGDVTTLGGSLHMDDKARVDGDVEVLGGAVHRAPGSHIGGSVSGNGTEDLVSSAANVDVAPKGWTLRGMLNDVANAITRSALLFVFGVIFWALGRQRMEALEVELAKRPMRSLAMGVVGLLTAVLLSIVLTVTVVGIPFAVAGLIVTVVVAYVGACVVLSTVGQALLRHRTENRYVHLALGCFLFLLFTAIPYVGGFVWLGVMLTGLGAVVATRGAGLVPTPNRNHGPYRTAAI